MVLFCKKTTPGYAGETEKVLLMGRKIKPPMIDCFVGSPTAKQKHKGGCPKWTAIV
jgi:hypothetical protein